MTDYDDLFESVAVEDSVFGDKGALDPLAEPDEIIAREDQERRLATILNGVHEGYLPTTISIYGPPGTGKTLTTRRVSQAFADRTDAVAVEYVNLKDCRTLFSAANEICYAVTGEKRGAYDGLDGVFTAIWEGLESYPEWTILLLDEVDHIQHDTNYDPNEFFYRLLRGEDKLAKDIQLSAWLISNELLEVDLQLDSRVHSVMSGEEVLFPPYGKSELAAILEPRVARAFRDGALPDDVFKYGVERAAARWGDARKALTLFRHAGETAVERDSDHVTVDCLDNALEATDRQALGDRLLALPERHFFVLYVLARDRVRPSFDADSTTTAGLQSAYNDFMATDSRIGERAIRELVTDLETIGLVETWIRSRGRNGREKRIRPAIDPELVLDAYDTYLDESEIATTEPDDVDP